jgi:hypothetical protein
MLPEGEKGLDESGTEVRVAERGKESNDAESRAICPAAGRSSYFSDSQIIDVDHSESAMTPITHYAMMSITYSLCYDADDSRYYDTDDSLYYDVNDSLCYDIDDSLCYVVDHSLAML